jgi:hypothetical protein
MEAKKLTEFLRQKEKRQKAVDWRTVRKKWVKSLEALRELLANWLQEPIRQNLLKIERTDAE